MNFSIPASPPDGGTTPTTPEQNEGISPSAPEQNKGPQLSMLPKTGEDSRALYYISRVAFIIVGLWMHRKMKPSQQ
ncbi:hypothetical protein [Bacillus sp. FJAT-27264]|uniref:hypothetical protein n=1 Tax=Paenibacillus sp. (strain DSM 101736 / FJAT-27264) TaxID=1850362 RepID=UPI001112C2D4|nr:hypothetical protein [Bacillus sp. FJAT-27264]